MKRLVIRPPLAGLLLGLALSAGDSPAQTPVSEIGFTRIIPGWTNYSTAFLAVHDTGSADYSTLAAGYTPLCDVQPVEVSAIFIWNGPLNKPPDFSAYQFQVGVWSSLSAMTNSPAAGNVANWTFAAPTGGSTTVPDTFTRGGRPAWLLRFALPQPAITLTNRLPKFIGLIVHGDSSHDGDLFIPTSSFHGPSDLQVSSLVAGGWTWLVNAGGSTIYDGELALELRVRVVSPVPTLSVQRVGDSLRLSWPASAGCYHLESSIQLRQDWSPVVESPQPTGSELVVLQAMTEAQRWFRLRR